MRKLSKIWAAMLCATLMFACTMPVSAEEQGQTKTKSLDVMLMVDDTVSMQRNDPNHIASLALQKFVERIPGEGSRIGMATYDDDILTSTKSLTGTDQAMMRVIESADRDSLKQYAQTRLTQDGRFTDLPGALYYAVKQIQSLPPMDSIPAIIAVSDGENDFISTAAEIRSDQMLEEVKKAGIPVYLIVIHASDRTDVTDYMQGIADDTGGKALFVDSGDEIDTFLVDVVSELYGLELSDNNIAIDIGPEPKDWAFALPTGVFEATLELTHKLDLDMELFGPDRVSIPLGGSQSVAVSSIQDRDGIKTIVRLMEPDEGNYVLRLSSPLGIQPVIGEIILNNEIYVQVDLSSNPAKKGDIIEVAASLMRGGEQYTDLEFANLIATVSIDESQPEEMEWDESKGAFQCSLTAPGKVGEHQMVVTVRGQKSFLRSSDPVTLTIASAGSGFSFGSGSGSSSSSDPAPGSMPVWVIVPAVALLLAIILIVVAMILRGRGSAGLKSQYIRLQGTLMVRYYDDGHTYTWEKYVNPSTYYSKRNPRESLGKLLRDQNQDFGDIPEYFDKIQIAGLQYGGGRLCVEVTGAFDTPSGLERVNQRIDIANGRGMDEMDGMDSFGGMSSTTIAFPDGTKTEIEFLL